MIKALGGSKIFQMGAEEEERERERKAERRLTQRMLKLRQQARGAARGQKPPGQLDPSQGTRVRQSGQRGDETRSLPTHHLQGSVGPPGAQPWCP